MKYQKIVSGRFVSRPNRFVARVEIGRQQVIAHVKNTGRCRELLVSGAKVYLEDFTDRMGNRKLAYSLIAVEKQTEKGPILVNMDSQAPNKVIKEELESGRLVPDGFKNLVNIKAEAVYGDSRLDFFIEDEVGEKGYIEVKGVTLERHSIVSFPDAPTKRGIKHLEELIKIAKKGYRAYILFLIQMEEIELLVPNDRTHPQFGEALRYAKKTGVNIMSYDCRVSPNSLTLARPVRVCLNHHQASEIFSP